MDGYDDWVTTCLLEPANDPYEDRTRYMRSYLLLCWVVGFATAVYLVSRVACPACQNR
jgi:hypothetical protein